MRVDPVSPSTTTASAGPAAARADDAAKALEQLFVQQLAKLALPSGDDGGDDDGSGDGGVTGQTSALVADALAQAVSAAGGLGLAGALAPGLGGTR